MRVVDQTQISPPPGSVPDSSLPITFFDLPWFEFPMSVDRCFFYHFPYSTTHFLESHLPNLKCSLSLTLQQFYPLAGKLRTTSSSSSSSDTKQQVELNYIDGDSVSLIVAESEEGDFLDLIGSHPRDISQFECLIPKLVDCDDGSRPLLAIKITVFPCRGICFGFSIPHVACDGFSYVHFVKSWVICNSKDHVSDRRSPPPSFDRTTLTTHHFEYYTSLLGEIFQLMKSCREKATPTPTTRCSSDTDDEHVVLATFCLLDDDIVRLKQWARSKISNSTFHLSTFVVTCAYLWVCFVKQGRYNAEEIVQFHVSVDWRKRLQPPAPTMYFGNCVCVSAAMLRVGDLIDEDGEGGMDIMAAMEAIVKTIEELGGGIGKVLEMEREKIKAVLRPNTVTMNVASSPKFGVYDVDFGWGRPVKVEVVTIRATGVALAESSDKQRGGIEIGVILPKIKMEEFSAIFTNGLKTLCLI